MVTPTDVWTALAPSAWLIVIVILAAVIVIEARGAARRMGTTSHRSSTGVYVTLMVVALSGLWLYLVGITSWGTWLFLFALIAGVLYGVISGLASRSSESRRASRG